MISEQRIAEISEELAERLLAIGDEPRIGKCHRIQFKIKTRDDNPILCEGDGGGMIHKALRSWFSRQLQALLTETK